MRYRGPTERQMVELNLSFVDEPVKVVALGDLPLGVAAMFRDDRPSDGLDAVLDEDFNHILQYQATSENVAEFFEAWSKASEEVDQMRSQADDMLAKILQGFNG